MYFLFSSSFRCYTPHQNSVGSQAEAQAGAFQMWPYYCKCNRVDLPTQGELLPGASAHPEFAPRGTVKFFSTCLLTLFE